MTQSRRPDVPFRQAPREGDSDLGQEPSARQADDALLDRVDFALSPAAFDQFVALLDNPPPPNDALRRLLLRKPLWEES